MFNKLIVFTIFTAIFLLPFAFTHAASSLYQTVVLDNAWTPTVRLDGTPTIGTLTLFPTYAELRNQSSSGTQYTGFVIPQKPGNFAPVTELTVEYAFIENVAGTCNMQLKLNTSSISGGSLSLPATVATTTYTFTGIASTFAGGTGQTASINLGGNASCNGTLRILSMTTDVDTVIPLSFSSLEIDVPPTSTSTVVEVVVDMASTTEAIEEINDTQQSALLIGFYFFLFGLVIKIASIFNRKTT